MKRRDFIAKSTAAIGASILQPAQALAKINPSESLAHSVEKVDGLSAQPTPGTMPLDDIHNLMEKVCKDKSGNSQVGAFFLVSWLVDNIKNDLKEAAPYFGRLTYPTPYTNISAGLSIDPTAVNLTIVGGAIKLEGFSPAIVYKEPNGSQRKYNTITITFKPVTLKLDEDLSQPGKLRFYLTTANPHHPDYPDFAIAAGTPDKQVMKDNSIDPKDYQTAEDVIRVSTAPMDILNSFVASLPVLGIVEAMRQFGIGEPMQFEFIKDIIIVHGPPNLSPASLCGPMAGTKITSSISNPSVRPNPGGNDNGFKLTFKHAVDPVNPTVKALDQGFGYYYPLEWSFKDFGIGVVGPGVAASDHGDFAMFHWEYHASARPKPNSVKVEIRNDPTGHPELKITINCPFDIGGVAGVSMKIGCVTVPLLSSAILGHIDPSIFVLKFALTDTSTGPAIVVTANYDCDVDIAFYGPPMIDVLLNILMGSFGNRLIAGELRRLANSLSFPLIDLSGLKYLTSPLAAWRLNQSFHKNSVLLGVEQHIEG